MKIESMFPKDAVTDYLELLIRHLGDIIGPSKELMLI